jgi:protein-S-isoprenylcysteine O-methyltransferase Ste14
VKRLLALGYAGVAYLTFVCVTLWAIGFLADLPAVPSTVDSRSRASTLPSLVVDLALLLVFAAQHSVMARPAVKYRLTRLVPPSVERASYVLATSLVLGLLFWQWFPIPTTVWLVAAQPWKALLWTGYALGWLVAVSATFMIDHLDFLGIRQANRHGAGRYRPPPFRERLLYAWIRHPMMVGLLMAFWVTPRMTLGHLVFAVAATGYIAVGVRLEERGLRAELGEVYAAYAERVPGFLPFGVGHPTSSRSGGGPYVERNGTP